MKEDLQHLGNMLKSNEIDVQSEAINALRKLNNYSALAIVLNFVADFTLKDVPGYEHLEYEDVLGEAVFLLGAKKYTPALEELRSKLLDTQYSFYIKEKCAQALASLSDGEFLLSLAKHPNDETRRSVIGYGLSELKGYEGVFDAIVEALSDSDSTVRHMAVYASQGLRDKKVTPHLRTLTADNGKGETGEYVWEAAKRVIEYLETMLAY